MEVNMLKQLYCKRPHFSTEPDLALLGNSRVDAPIHGVANQRHLEAAHDRFLGATIAEHVAAADALKRVRRRVDRG